MEGKGWFIIYGVLFILIITQWVMVAGLNSRLKALETKGVASTTVTPEPNAQASPQATASAGPDLSTPEARDAQRKKDLAEIKTALMEYRNEKKSFPKEMNELSPDFLEIIPADPLAPKYTYRYVRTGAGFRLTAVMENPNDADDGKDGKKDKIYTVTEKSP